MSSDEIEVMNTSVVQEDVSPENNPRREESDSHSDCINIRNVVALTQKAMEARRYRQKKKALKPPKPKAKTPAERSKAYRERRRFAKANAITPAPIPSKKGKIVSNSTSSVHLLSPNDGPEYVLHAAQIHNQHSMPKPHNIPQNLIRQQRNRNNASEIDFDVILEAPVQEAIITQPNYDNANNGNIDVHDEHELPNRESLGDLDFDRDIEEYFDGPPIEFDDDFVPPYSGYSVMPRKCKGANLSRRTVNARAVRDKRALRSGEQIEKDNENARVRMAQLRQSQSQEARDVRNQQRQLHRREARRFIVNRLKGIVHQRQQVHQAFTSGPFCSVVSNREAIMEFPEATDILSNRSNEEKEVRRRKLNFLGYCLYEYTQRAEYHLNSDVNDELIYKRAIEFRDLLQIDNFTPNKSWIKQFKAAFSINPPDPKVAITRRPRTSMDLRSIMSFCGQYSSMAPNLEPKPHTPLISGKSMDQILNHSKALVFASSRNQGISAELESENEDDDDCVAVESPTEFVEIKNEDDIDRYDSLSTPITQELDDCPVKVENLHHSPLHIHDYQSTEGNMPETDSASSPGYNSDDSEDAPLPKCVDNFKDALRLLKPLEDFALMRENYRIIGLLSQLETIFEAGKKAEENGSSVE